MLIRACLLVVDLVDEFFDGDSVDGRHFPLDVDAAGSHSYQREISAVDSGCFFF